MEYLYPVEYNLNIINYYQFMDKCLFPRNVHHAYLLEQKTTTQHRLHLTNERAMKLCVPSPGKKHSPACVALFRQIEDIRQELDHIENDIQLMDRTPMASFDSDDDIANREYDC